MARKRRRRDAARPNPALERVIQIARFHRIREVDDRALGRIGGAQLPTGCPSEYPGNVLARETPHSSSRRISTPDSGCGSKGGSALSSITGGRAGIERPPAAITIATKAAVLAASRAASLLRRRLPPTPVLRTVEASVRGESQRETRGSSPYAREPVRQAEERHQAEPQDICNSDGRERYDDRPEVRPPAAACRAIGMVI